MPRRSRGCRACRQRRIGCDGALPSCRQCLLTNRQCSGPLQGTIIIDQTASVKTRYRKAPFGSDKKNVSMMHQPSYGKIWSLAFASEIFSMITSTTDRPTRPAWLRRLSDVPLNERGLALDLSLQALAIAYYGATSSNSLVVQHAWLIYGKALSGQSKAVSYRSDASSATIIYTSVIMSLFEAVCSTDVAAYAAHLAATRKMLALASSQLAQNELLRQVALHVQYQTLLMMIASPLDYLALEPDTDMWTRLTLNMANSSQQVADQLIPQLFKLGKILSAKIHDPENPVAHCNDIRSNIDKIWTGYEDQANLRGEYIQYNLEGEIKYRNGSTAIVTSYYTTAKMMFSLAEPQKNASEINNYCQIIIECAMFLFRTHSSVGCALLPSFLPLTLVAMYSPSPNYRRMAYNLLNDRVLGTPFAGLRSIILQQIGSVDKNTSPCGIDMQMAVPTNLLL
ncbi:hypothetical protein BGW36DRAFT_425082 [Talaromyces proteolyticus]|uniref:Zn(2)-C6 fungal-type domain-containing protein n=1 Tax=Talaromyces proteolyticus TaxID=1131652 RepID=A0AAD4Q2E8_9EURO|nr:uncharacterized protein BGW36DRAFT_425082 [Talaromyces proteolyticus]KAH8700253.1 hypothetical protein BGW36DRAFT_425082 [Talaromyces proteolyticus]